VIQAEMARAYTNGARARLAVSRAQFDRAIRAADARRASPRLKRQGP
jgi:hypothetical protein